MRQLRQRGMQPLEVVALGRFPQLLCSLSYCKTRHPTRPLFPPLAFPPVPDTGQETLCAEQRRVMSLVQLPSLPAVVASQKAVLFPSQTYEISSPLPVSPSGGILPAVGYTVAAPPTAIRPHAGCRLRRKIRTQDLMGIMTGWVEVVEVINRLMFWIFTREVVVAVVERW